MLVAGNPGLYSMRELEGAAPGYLLSIASAMTTDVCLIAT